MSVGENIKNIRTQRGMTQAELGEKVAVSEGMIRHYESGRKVPTLAVFCELATVLGVTLEELKNGKAG